MVTEQPDADPVTPPPVRTVTTGLTRQAGGLSGLCRYGATLTVWLVPALSASMLIGWTMSGGRSCGFCAGPIVGVACTRTGNDSREPLAATVNAPSPLAAAVAASSTVRPPVPDCFRSTSGTCCVHEAVYSTVAGSSPLGSHAWQSRGMSTERG